jgi:hypothetical protein
MGNSGGSSNSIHRKVNIEAAKQCYMSLRVAEAEIGKILLEIGGILIMVIGAVDVIKAVIMIALAGALGGLISGFLPSIKWLVDLLIPFGYALAAGMLVVGIILAVIGYKIYRLGLLPGIPSNKRNMWIVILVILLAVALLAGEVYTSIALVVPLVGLVLMPVEQLPPPSP